MKKYLRPLLLVVPLALAACYDTDTEIEVKDDGTVKFKTESYMSRSVYKMFTKVAGGEGYVQQQCESGGGKFSKEIAHVKCSSEFDTSIDDLMAGNVQNEKNKAPLDLSGLTLADNGDGTYAIDYKFDWTILTAAEEMPTADAATEAADQATDDANKVEGQEEKMDDQASKDEEKVDDEAAKDETKAEDEASKDEEKMDDEASKDASSDEKEMDKQSEDDAKSMKAAQEKVQKYLEGYKITIKLKAPHIASGSGEINGSADEMTYETNLGGELPVDYQAVFSTQKQ